MSVWILTPFEPLPGRVFPTGDIADLTVGDFDGDGHDDIAWTTTASVEVVAGAALVPMTLTLESVTSVGAVDVDADGYDDLVLAGYRDDVVLRGGPSGLDPAVSWPLVAAEGHGIHPLGDVDGDGFSDFSDGRSWWRGSADGPVSAPALGLGYDTFEAWAAGDVDGDGFGDLFFGHRGGYYEIGPFELHLGGPDGPSPEARWTWNRYGGTWSVAVADIDEDGVDEAVVVHGFTDHSYVSGRVYVLAGLDGDAPVIVAEGLHSHSPFPRAPDLLVSEDGEIAMAYLDRIVGVAVDGADVIESGVGWISTGDDVTLAGQGTGDLDGDGDIEVVGGFSVLGAGAVVVWGVARPPADTGGDTGGDSGHSAADTGRAATADTSDSPESEPKTARCGCGSARGPVPEVLLTVAALRRRRVPRRP